MTAVTISLPSEFPSASLLLLCYGRELRRRPTERNLLPSYFIDALIMYVGSGIEEDNVGKI